MHKMSNIGQFCPSILFPYLSDYSLRLSASDIGRKTDFERRTVSRLLNKLSSVHLIDYTFQGKNKLFYFDLKKISTSSLLELIELHKRMNWILHNKKLEVLIQKLNSCAESVIIFGSYANAKQTKNSDLDIVLLGNVNKTTLAEIKKKSSIEINEHIITYSQFKKQLQQQNPLAIEIQHNHILFGNISQIVQRFMEVVSHKQN